MKIVTLPCTFKGLLRSILMHRDEGCDLVPEQTLHFIKRIKDHVKRFFDVLRQWFDTT